jgi:TonB family protein
MTQQPALKYGAFELRALYPKFALRALAIAGLIHVAVIGSYYVVAALTVEEDRTFFIHRIPGVVLSQPPSNNRSQTVPKISIVARPSAGIPVPIPDAEISPDATIAAQPELNQPSIIGDSAAGDGGTLIVTETIDEEIPSDIFRPVEKFPVPVVSPAPRYPEIARRAGVEGTVWIRIWVTKEGKAKKAEVLNSESDLFNQSALDAAMHWVFTPAVMNNGPVAVWISIPFRFKLHEGR